MADEQRVRTMCGGIGVEISRSRVRTPGKVGYGLWRVRGSVHRTQLAGLVPEAITPDRLAERTPWSPCAFMLAEVELAVRRAIETGIPERPGRLMLLPSAGSDPGLPMGFSVPARWTSAYRGRRDLGVVRSTCEGCNRREVGGGICVAHPLVGDGSTARQRQREMNAEFQAGHLERRAHGKAVYHAAKLARMHSPGTTET